MKERNTGRISTAAGGHKATGGKRDAEAPASIVHDRQTAQAESAQALHAARLGVGDLLMAAAACRLSFGAGGSQTCVAWTVRSFRRRDVDPTAVVLPAPLCRPRRVTPCFSSASRRLLTAVRYGAFETAERRIRRNLVRKQHSANTGRNSARSCASVTCGEGALNSQSDIGTSRVAYSCGSCPTRFPGARCPCTHSRSVLRGAAVHRRSVRDGSGLRPGSLFLS
jgi:hypothetical protein